MSLNQGHEDFKPELEALMPLIQRHEGFKLENVDFMLEIATWFRKPIHLERDWVFMIGKGYINRVLWGLSGPLEVVLGDVSKISATLLRCFPSLYCYFKLANG